MFQTFEQYLFDSIFQEGNDLVGKHHETITLRLRNDRNIMVARDGSILSGEPASVPRCSSSCMLTGAEDSTICREKLSISLVHGLIESRLPGDSVKDQ